MFLRYSSIPLVFQSSGDTCSFSSERLQSGILRLKSFSIDTAVGLELGATLTFHIFWDDITKTSKKKRESVVGIRLVPDLCAPNVYFIKADVTT